MNEVPGNWPVVFVARHAQSAGDVDVAPAAVAASGTRGAALTVEGERQAMALALTLLGAGIEAVYASDALHAEQTGTIIAERLRLPLTISKSLRESQGGAPEDERE